MSVRGAGLRHAWIRTSDGTYHDIDAVVNLGGDLEVDETTVEGDDQDLAIFASKPRASISITANALTPEVIAAITGQTVTTISEVGPPAVAGVEVAGGGNGAANPPFVEVGGYTVGRLKATGAAQTIARIFHKVQLRMTSSEQAKDSEFNVEFEGVAFSTTTDVEGTALASERVDTLRYTNEDVDTLIADQTAP